MIGYEDDGSQFKVLWKAIKDFEDSAVPLYPDGLSEILATLSKDQK